MGWTEGAGLSRFFPQAHKYIPTKEAGWQGGRAAPARDGSIPVSGTNPGPASETHTRDHAQGLALARDRCRDAWRVWVPWGRTQQGLLSPFPQK